MNKLLAITLIAGASVLGAMPTVASAHTSVTIGIGGYPAPYYEPPRVYYRPAPVYYYSPPVAYYGEPGYYVDRYDRDDRRWEERDDDDDHDRGYRDHGRGHGRGHGHGHGDR